MKTFSQMTPAEVKTALRAETRDWLKKGVLPAEAARVRRMWAEGVKGDVVDWHLAVAAEWDRIAATQPEKVRAAYAAKLAYEQQCLANQTPGSDLAAYWTARIAETEATIAAL